MEILYSCSTALLDKRKKKAFLDVLLDENEKADKPLTNDELKEQVETFMFGVSLDEKCFVHTHIYLYL